MKRVLIAGLALAGLMVASAGAPAAADDPADYVVHGKISGNIGGVLDEYDPPLGGPGNFAFQGWVAKDQDGNLHGQIEVNYRDLKEQCVFTPNANSTLEIVNWPGTPNDGQANDLFLGNWSTPCVTGIFADMADIVLMDRSQHASGPRGYIRIDADTFAGPDTYDVGEEGEAWPLDNGNVIVKF